MNSTLAEIAKLVHGIVHGDPGVRITGVNGIMEARPGDLVMVRDRKYAARLGESRAAAVLATEPPAGDAIPAILVPDPDHAFALVLQHIEEAQRCHPTGIHETAVVSESARLGDRVALGAHVCVGAESEIGDGVVLYPGVVVGARVRIGADTIIYPNVTLREDTEIGRRCLIHANTAIGSDGFGFVPREGRWAKIPQVGRVVIEDDVEIGSNTAVDRAKCGETRIGRGTKIDNCVQIGHNARIGEHCVLAGMVGIAGSAIIGNHVRLAAGAGVAGHLTIGDGTTIGARGGVVRSVPPGSVLSGFPAIDHETERRAMVARERLPAMLRRVRQLERRLEALEKGTHEQTENNS